jgi:hypothetical protein
MKGGKNAKMKQTQAKKLSLVIELDERQFYGGLEEEDRHEAELDSFIDTFAL